jgi:hypothetical protein
LGLELDQRLEQLERRVLSDLGDGRGTGNVWRNVKENAGELARLAKSFAEFGSKIKESQAADRESFERRLNVLEQRLTAYEAKAEADRARIDAVATTDAKQTRDISELYELNEKQQRMIESLSDRLNGKGLVQVDPYEKIVAQVRQLADSMQGGEGQLSFAQVRNSIQQTQFLGQVLYGAIGLFGVGGVLAAGVALFGGESVPPEVQAIQTELNNVVDDVQRLEGRWDSFVQDSLNQQQPR